MFVVGKQHPVSDRPRPGRHSPLAEPSLNSASQPVPPGVRLGTMVRQGAAPSAAGCWPHFAADGAASPAGSSCGVRLLCLNYQGNDRRSPALVVHCEARPSESADPKTYRSE
jgi:hypothetical protein